jgi:hypothetical protein
LGVKIMNPKIVLAFLTGALAASGIVYVAVKPEAGPRTLYVTPDAPPPAVAKTVATTPTVTIGPVERRPEPARVAPVRVAPVRMAPVRMAQAQPLPARPMREPINKERPVNDSKPEPPDMRPDQPAPVVAPVVAPAPPPVVEEAPRFEPAPERAPERLPHVVTIPAGTLLPVRMGETVSARNNQPGDSFFATLDQPLVVDGFVIAERGAHAEGRVVEAGAGGRVRGLSRLGVELVRLTTSDGQHVRIATASFVKQAQPSAGTDAAKIGGGAAIGAAIGAIAGGGKGAGIGAGVGGAAGAGDVLLTHGKSADLPVETRISFRLNEPVTITERLR